MPNKTGFCIRYLTHIQKTDIHAAGGEGDKRIDMPLVGNIVDTALLDALPLTS